MKKIALTLFLTLTFICNTFSQGFFEHTIKAGESIASIVQKYEVSPYEVYELNPDVKKNFKTGAVLVLLKTNNYPFDPNFIALKKHKIKRNENLKSIAKKYDIDVATLKKFNPKLYSKNIKKGCKLKIPVFQKPQKNKTIFDATIETKKTTINHTVQTKETWFGIATKYNTTIVKLKEDNNHAVATGLQPGQIIQIVKKKTTTNSNDVNTYETYIVQPKEGFFRITKNTGISKEELINLNPELSEGIKKGMLLKYPKKATLITKQKSYNLLDSIINYKQQNITFILPLRLHTIIDTDSTFNLKKIIKRDRIMNLSLDFYTGLETATDSLKQLGITVNTRIIDTQYSRNKKTNSKRISEIIALNYTTDEIVIGPILPTNVQPLVNGLATKNIAVFTPFAVKNEFKSSNLHETSAPIASQRKKMIEFLENYTKDKKVIIVADNTVAEIKNELKIKFPTASVIKPRKGGLLIPKDFNGILSNTQENVVIVESKKTGLIATLVSILDTKLSKYKITLATTSSKKQFDKKTIENRYKTKLNFHFPSVNKPKAFSKDNNFIKKYKKKYGKYPNRYAIRGFDLVFDTVLRNANTENLEQAVTLIGKTEYLENKFRYTQNTSGGFTNTSIYILHYTKDFKIEEAKFVDEVLNKKINN